MHTSSTAQALIQVRGPSITYNVLKFRPTVDSRANSFEVTGFSIRRGDNRYTLEDFPVSRALTEGARDDILYHTFEADEDVRSTYHEIDFEIPEYDEVVRIHFRAIDRDEYMFFEVEDSSGDWIPVEDVPLAGLLGDAFIRTLETSAMDQLSSRNLEMLPMAAE